eukprot:3541147-Rhodomonas_salina.1
MRTQSQKGTFGEPGPGPKPGPGCQCMRKRPTGQPKPEVVDGSARRDYLTERSARRDYLTALFQLVNMYLT